jgi:hypothetical protein
MSKSKVVTDDHVKLLARALGLISLAVRHTRQRHPPSIKWCKWRSWPRKRVMMVRETASLVGGAWWFEWVHMSIVSLVCILGQKCRQLTALSSSTCAADSFTRTESASKVRPSHTPGPVMRSGHAAVRPFEARARPSEGVAIFGNRRSKTDAFSNTSKTDLIGPLRS